MALVQDQEPLADLILESPNEYSEDGGIQNIPRLQQKQVGRSSEPEKYKMLSAAEADVLKGLENVDMSDPLVAMVARLSVSMALQHSQVMARLDRQQAQIQQLVGGGAATEFFGASPGTAGSLEGLTESQVEESVSPFTHVTPDGTRKSLLFRSRTREDLQRKQNAYQKGTVGGSGERPAGGVEPQWRRQLQVMTSSTAFEVFFATAILINAIAIGVDVQFAPVLKERGGRIDAFQTTMKVISYALIIIFVVEVILRMLSQGRKWASAAWNWFDLIVVISSLWEPVADLIVATSELEPGGGSTVRVIRIVQMARLARATRLVQLIRWIKGLRTLVDSLTLTVKKVGWALILLFVIIYLFGIVLAQATADFMNDPANTKYNKYLELYWGDLARCMYTLFKCITDGVHWEYVVTPLQDMSPLWPAVFCAFIAFQHLAVLHVITAVFCESAIHAAQHDHDMLVHNILENRSKYVSKLRTLFESLDDSHSGVITLDTLEEHIQNEQVQAFFRSMELDIQDAWSFFKLLDQEGSGFVEIEDFLVGCCKLQGGAKSMDVAMMYNEQQWLSKKLLSFMQYCEAEFDDMRTSMRNQRRGQARRFVPQPQSSTLGGSSRGALFTIPRNRD